MIHLANHHSHTNFSDGHATPEQFVNKALDNNLVTLGFSDHAPIPVEGLVGMKLEDLPSYSLVIDRLRNQTQEDLQIYKSLEVDYIPGIINVDSPHIQSAGLDYILGAVHYVGQFADGSFWSFESGQEHFERGLHEIYSGDIREAISRYYELIREMLNLHTPDIVAHLDRIKKLNGENRYFNEKEKWYRELVTETLETIAAKNVIMEINTKGVYKNETSDTYPSFWILEIANELGIATHLASDAHHPDDLQGAFDFGLKQLKKAGYKKTFIRLDNEWQDSALIGDRIFIF
ncbi:MAG: histidinol-phosphatase [Saprospiraceae bacterium]|nr:histidinol-phosphatase [Saprospiraceae bacterium]